MLYTPELSIGTTKGAPHPPDQPRPSLTSVCRHVGTACCSDQQSFFDAGFPAIWAFERHAGDGGIADPAYHDSTDRCRREGFDVEQAVGISRCDELSRAVASTRADEVVYRLQGAGAILFLLFDAGSATDCSFFPVRDAPRSRRLPNLNGEEVENRPCIASTLHRLRPRMNASRRSVL